MYEEQFSKRLAELRTKKGVSARDMSLSIGQNPGYIRAIECGTTFPTMSNFFYICEYLNVTPQEFFNFSEEPSNGMNGSYRSTPAIRFRADKCTCCIYQNHRKKVISFSSCGCMIKYSTAFDFTV